MSVQLNNEGSPLLLDAVTTGSCVIGAERAHFTHGGFYVVFSPQTHGGQVVIEAAHQANFLGQWHVLATVPWLAGYRAQYVPVGGPQLAVRVRVSTPVIGGTVSVYGVAH